MAKTARFASSGNLNFGKAQSSGPGAMTRSLTAPQINLEELFGSNSPERTRKSSSPRNSFLAPPSKDYGFGRMDGSPVAPNNRSRPNKPKGKMRRTLSMFNDPAELEALPQFEMPPQDDDMMMGSPKQEAEAVHKVSAGERYLLPAFNVKDDPLRRITVETMGDVLSGAYKDQYDELIIIDCRFDYEYKGGHIDGARNLNGINTLEDEFNVQDDENRPDIEPKRRLIIFHCEFSAHRAPRM